jgi:putative ABC transport system permease protein
MKKRTDSLGKVPLTTGWLRTLLSRVGSIFHNKNLDTDLDEELHAHIAMAVEENLQRGMQQHEARTTALRSFGGITQTRERYRTQRGLPFFETLVQDLRYAVRQLRKAPGFAATAILTLALGVGAVTAVFSVVDGVLLRPYDFSDSGRIVVWRESIREMEHVAPLLPDNYRHYLNLKAHASMIVDAAIVQPSGFSVSTGAAINVSDDLAHPHEAEGMAISPNFFSVLGITPVLGRVFTQDEAQPGRDKEVIMTWAAWQRLYHGDRAVLGTTMRIDGAPVTIVGVLPQSFRFPVMSVMPGQATFGSTERYEFFRPLVPMPSELTADDGDFNFVVVARLKPGVTIQQAQSELDGIEKATAAVAHLTIHLSLIVEPFAQEITGDVSKPIWLLFAAVFGVLLMACVNLANLQIARGVTRAQETALRAALGASRLRLLQGVLIENLLLGLAGGVGGILCALVGEKLLVLKAANLPRMNEIHLSAPMLILALCFSILTALGFGILPALRGLRVTPQSVLQANAVRFAGGRQAASSRRVLVSVEVACSVTLLMVTALMARSFSHLLTQERHFNAQRMAMVRADLSVPRYSSGPGMPDDPGADAGSLARDAMINRTLDRLRSLPGVQAAALTNVLPLSGDTSVDGLVRPDHPVPRAIEPMANRRFISPGYFETMGIPLIAGRDFDQRERGNPRTVILSEKAAQAAFSNENPLGRKLLHWGRIYTVVGIAADARITDLKRNSAVFYLPYWDFPPTVPVFLVRSAQSAEALIPSVRQAIWSVDSEVAIPAVTTLEAQVDDSVATERFQAMVLSSFGGAALLIAVLGIYGVLAYSVTQRTQEFGIRIALGSSRTSLGRLVLRDASYPVLGGIVLGLVGAACAVRWVRSLLYETSIIDPWAIGLSLAVLLTAALIAALLPVRNAISVDPMRTLRSE